MTIAGHIYGVVLNDRSEPIQHDGSFEEAPYNGAPKAPVVYMKPRSAIAHGPVCVRSGEELVAAPTLALLISRDAIHCAAETALDCIGAACLAVDFCLPQASYYRPAVGLKNQDGFLVMGDWMAVRIPPVISLQIDGEQSLVWSLDRLLRGPAQLIADLSAFMTLRAGDVLMVGLPGDAPIIRAGQSLKVTADDFPELVSALVEQP